MRKWGLLIRLSIGQLALSLLVMGSFGFAAFQDDPADPDGDGFTNGEEQLMSTNPTVFDQNLSDSALLTLLQKRNFDFFWLESTPPFFLAPDRGFYNQVGGGSNAKSIASTGFALTAYVVADYHGWVDHVEVYNRIKSMFARLREIQQSSDASLNKHGFFYHFVDNSGARFIQSGFNSEISSIDHALLLAGVLLAGQYYKGTEVEILANALYDNTDWGFMFGNLFFHQGWLPNGGPVEGGSYFERWDRYSELMILLLEGMGSTTHPVTPQTWADFNRDTVTYPGFQPYVHCGALFTHQFSHLWVDFRNKRDIKGINYFDNSRVATLVNRKFCIDLNANDPSRYETYGSNSWGISSGDSSLGYSYMQPDFFVPSMVEHNCDSGTVVPDSALSSIPFTPSESIAAAQNWFTNRRSETFGRYGFRSAFNFGRPNNPSSLSHFPSSKLSLDCGSVVSMIENFRTGLIWKYFGRNVKIQDAMNKAGFVNDFIPFSINFDNQPIPGHDFNSFGGFSDGFGGGMSSYPSIAPVNSTVGGFVWKISGTGSGAGAFNTLNAKDSSRFDTLSFWIKGLQGGEQILVGLKDVSNTEVSVPVSDYIGGGAIATDFKGVRIPLRVFSDRGVRLTTMDNISFRFTSAQGGDILVDDIAFLPDEFKPAQPLGVQGTVISNDVSLTWTRNTDSDLVGYSVYRGTSESGPFTKLNNLLIVENSFRDVGVLSASGTVFYYKITAVDNALVPNESLMSSGVVLPNARPKLDAIGNKAVVAGNLLAFTVSATDPNNDPLTFSASNLPPGATFSPATRIFSWNPSITQVGVYNNVHFSVTDGQFTASEDISIAVPDNDAGTIDTAVEDIATGQPSSAALAFGTVGSNAGFMPSTKVIRLTALSSANNWKVQIYTDNANNAIVTTTTIPAIKWKPAETITVVTANPYTGSGSAGGLVGQKSSKYRVPMKWVVFPNKITQTALPVDKTLWGFVLDRKDSNFANAVESRTVLDASGNLGNFPSSGRTLANATEYLYLAADFTGAPAQAYSTNQFLVEIFKQ